MDGEPELLADVRNRIGEKEQSAPRDLAGEGDQAPPWEGDVHLDFGDITRIAPEPIDRRRRWWLGASQVSQLRYPDSQGSDSDCLLDTAVSHLVYAPPPYVYSPR